MSVLALGVALGGLEVVRALPFLMAQGMGGPVRVEGEVGSLATYGKWWVLPPHGYITDGFSGEMPAYYNYLSDSLINLLAAMGDWPSLTVQVVLYGPLLAMVFFWGNVASLRLVTAERASSLIGGLLLSLSGSSGLLSFFFGLPDVDQVTKHLHVPATALGLGTSQSLGWVFFLPALATFYAAQESFTRRRAVFCGLLTGLLPHVHTLTLINVAFGQIACATAMNGMRLSPGRRRRAWLLALAVIAAVFGVHASVGRISTPVLAGYAALVFVLNLLVSPDRRPYLWIYGVAVVVAAPYAASLLRGGWPTVFLSEVRGFTVSPGQVAAFYAAHLAAATLILFSQIPRFVPAFLLPLLSVTAWLSYNGFWGWDNHPYRFAIHLVFPLCGLAALGLTRAPKPWALLVGFWLGLTAAGTVLDKAGQWRGPERIQGFGSLTATFLPAVRAATGELPADSRLLNFPEYVYPREMQLNTLLFSFSRRPGFIPDYRYLLGRERYFNRLGVFCFLFPRYPAEDWNLGQRRACDECLSPPADLLTIRDRRLRTAVVPLYGLGLAASLAPPFSNDLARAEEDYGWGLVLEQGARRRLVRPSGPNLPGLAPVGRLRENLGAQIIPFDVACAGDHVLVLGGRRLRERVSRVRVDDRDCPEGQWRDNWVVIGMPLGDGPHELLLQGSGRDPDGERDILYFVAIVERSYADAYLDLAPGSL